MKEKGARQGKSEGDLSQPVIDNEYSCHLMEYVQSDQIKYCFSRQLSGERKDKGLFARSFPFPISYWPRVCPMEHKLLWKDVTQSLQVLRRS